MSSEKECIHFKYHICNYLTKKTTFIKKKTIWLIGCVVSMATIIFQLLKYANNFKDYPKN